MTGSTNRDKRTSSFLRVPSFTNSFRQQAFLLDLRLKLETRALGIPRSNLYHSSGAPPLSPQRRAVYECSLGEHNQTRLLNNR